MEEELNYENIITHYGENPSEHMGAVTPPIYQSSLFVHPNAESWMKRREGGRYDYTRFSNPTTAIFERKMAALEKGEKAVTFSSGMGAIAATIISCVKAGDNVILADTTYYAARTLLDKILKRFGVTTTYVKGIDPEDFERAIKPETKLIYLETPTSILFRLQDLKAIADIAKPRGIITVCDNSWATPLYQNPIELGIDMVIHACTKYIGGHADLQGGVVIGSGEHIKRIVELEAPYLGATPDPFASWLTLRGLRTLPVRLERHQKTAAQVTQFLDEHPKVARVHYPGLDSYPQRELAKRQLRGCTGLFSLALKDNTQESTYKFVDSLKTFYIGASWGGHESLVIPLKIAPGVEPGEEWVVRLNLGLENAEDIISDLDNALSKV